MKLEFSDDLELDPQIVQPAQPPIRSDALTFPQQASHESWTRILANLAFARLVRRWQYDLEGAYCTILELGCPLHLADSVRENYARAHS